MKSLPAAALSLLSATFLFGVIFLNPFRASPPVITPVEARAYLPVAGTRVQVQPHPEPMPSPSLSQDGRGPQGALTEPSNTATLEFVGDIMLARSVEQYIKKYGPDYPFAKVGDLLQKNDLLIGNFEGTVRTKENIEGLNVMNFDTIPANVSILAAQGFDLLSLSNNHAEDFGRATTELTRETITKAGITPFGDGWDSEKYIARKTVNGIAFSFIGYHAFLETTPSIVEAIKAEKAAGNFVIVFAHWGVEYKHDPSSSQVFAAHQFIDAGANAIIGAHPHVIQTVETYKNAPIVYSLGNFLFDQDFSEATKSGIAVRMTVEEKKLTLNFQPLYLEKRQMMPATGEKAKAMLETLGVPSGVLEIVR